MKMTQFSLFLQNKTGELARVVDTLGRAGVNIEGLAISDGIHTGIMKVVVDKPAPARAALAAANVPCSEQEVLVVPLRNTPGALADLCTKLALEGLSIDYIYGSTCGHATTEASGCRLMVSVSDVPKAQSAIGLALGGWPRP